MSGSSWYSLVNGGLERPSSSSIWQVSGGRTQYLYSLSLYCYCHSIHGNSLTLGRFILAHGFSFCPSREGMHSPSWCFTEAVHITVGKEEEHNRNQGLCHPQRLSSHLVTYCHGLCPPSMRFCNSPKQRHLLGTKYSMPKPAGDCRFSGP